MLPSRRRPPRPPPDTVTKNYYRFLNGSKTGEDGLTYKESTFPATPSVWNATSDNGGLDGKPAPWDLVIADEREGRTGAHSLVHYARKTINAYIDELSVEALKATPWDPFGRMLWADAVATKRASLETWSRFNAAYPTVDFGNRQYDLHAHERLPPLIAAVSSSEFTWLVDLSFRLSEATTDGDLLAVPHLENLRSLYVAPSPDATVTVDDGVVRMWCRAAVRHGRFSKLETLAVKGFGRLSVNVLEYTSWIKSLQLLDCGSRFAGSAEKNPFWEPVQVEAFRQRLKEVRGEDVPVIDVHLGLSRGGQRRRDGDALFARRPNDVALVSVKRKLETPATKGPRVVRQRKMKDMGDLLAEFTTTKIPNKR